MCYGCWEEAGSPQIKSDKVFKAAKMIAELYSLDGSAGNLHVEVEDYNLDDSFFEEKALNRSFGYEMPAQLAIERELYLLLKNMTEDERYSSVALYDGFWAI